MKFAKEVFLHLSVMLFTGGGGGLWLPRLDQGDMHSWGEFASRGVCIGGLHPGGRPPGIPWGTVNEQEVRILLECILA